MLHPGLQTIRRAIVRAIAPVVRRRLSVPLVPMGNINRQ
jgi:hypothetical protein